MHPEVDWPNAWEGGRVVGQAAVRDYWNRQFATISSKVEPEGFTEEPDGSVTVDVHRDAAVGLLGEAFGLNLARDGGELSVPIVTDRRLADHPAALPGVWPINLRVH